MRDLMIAAAVVWQATRREVLGRIAHDESGEGVVSTAIAVLVMAFLGAAMWVAFNAVFSDAQGKIATQINSIGG